MLVVKEYIVLSDQASFPPIICFQILFRPKPWYPPAEDQKHTPRFIRGRSESWGFIGVMMKHFDLGGFTCAQKVFIITSFSYDGVLLSGGCNYLFLRSSLARDLLPSMFSCIRSVCFCYVFSDLATFETQLNILLFFKPLLFLPLNFFFILPFSLYLGFPGLCSVSNLY
ncbi:hypothetical protein GmHk_16G045503 [Glycine max]|nr:hypothetical protein GmHk_16G045503 [Glycine max]